MVEESNGTVYSADVSISKNNSGYSSTKPIPFDASAVDEVEIVYLIPSELADKVNVLARATLKKANGSTVTLSTRGSRRSLFSNSDQFYVMLPDFLDCLSDGSAPREMTLYFQATPGDRDGETTLTLLFAGDSTQRQPATASAAQSKVRLSYQRDEISVTVDLDQSGGWLTPDTNIKLSGTPPRQMLLQISLATSDDNRIRRIESLKFVDCDVKLSVSNFQSSAELIEFTIDNFDEGYALAGPTPMLMAFLAVGDEPTKDGLNFLLNFTR